MAFISQISFLTLLIIICSYIVDHFFPKFYRTVVSHEIVGQLKWAWDFLIQYSFFKHRRLDLTSGFIGDLGVTRFEGCMSSEPVECSVCLCKIEEGEEIRELRCGHLFHRVCLDRWVHGYRRVTCPLCRDNLAWPRMAGEFGREILLFNNFSSVGSTDRDTWWLR